MRPTCTSNVATRFVLKKTAATALCAGIGLLLTARFAPGLSGERTLCPPGPRTIVVVDKPVEPAPTPEVATLNAADVVGTYGAGLCTQCGHWPEAFDGCTVTLDASGTYTIAGCTDEGGRYTMDRDMVILHAKAGGEKRLSAVMAGGDGPPAIGGLAVSEMSSMSVLTRLGGER